MFDLCNKRKGYILLNQLFQAEQNEQTNLLQVKESEINFVFNIHGSVRRSRVRAPDDERYAARNMLSCQ